MNERKIKHLEVSSSLLGVGNLVTFSAIREDLTLASILRESSSLHYFDMSIFSKQNDIWKSQQHTGLVKNYISYIIHNVNQQSSTGLAT
jgi:hypothetical protein